MDAKKKNGKTFLNIAVLGCTWFGLRVAPEENPFCDSNLDRFLSSITIFYSSTVMSPAHSLCILVRLNWPMDMLERLHILSNHFYKSSY